MTAPIDKSQHWQGYDAIIDVRSPSEYANDHIPGAVNLPVLDDAERAEIGTIYKQTSPFAARKRGAAIISRNIARHLCDAKLLVNQPVEWSPLIYCWRGGQRSGAMARVLAEIGWRVAVLAGGYKHYRRQVLAGLADLALSLVVIDGATGSGKTAILKQYAKLTGQAIDLEGLSHHRGSLLGADPDTPQPSQCMFESGLYAAVAELDATKPVLIEGESSRLGEVHIPPALWQLMGAAPRLRITARLPTRVAYIVSHYAHLTQNPNAVKQLLAFLAKRQSKQNLAELEGCLAAEDWSGLVAGLLRLHYDPSYAHAANQRGGAVLDEIALATLEDASFASAAGHIKKLLAKLGKSA